MAKILADLFKGEEEDFVQLSIREGCSGYNPADGSWRCLVESICCPSPQPENHSRADDPGYHDDPETSVNFKDGVFYQESLDDTKVAVTADHPGALPSSTEEHGLCQPRPLMGHPRGRPPLELKQPPPQLREEEFRLGPSVQARDLAEHTAAGAPPEDPDDVSVTNYEVESVMNHRLRRESLRHVAFTDKEFNTFNSVDAYLGAARTGLEGIVGLFSSKMQAVKEQNNKLSEDLMLRRTHLAEAKADLEATKKATSENSAK